MITRFSVKNFRCFDDWTHFDLTADKKYEFNENAVQNNAIQHSMVYGENGEGKSNLGLAMLELVSHLSQKRIQYPTFGNAYFNANSSADVAEFKFEFYLNQIKIKYSYGKASEAEIVYEELLIAGKIVLTWDKRVSNEALINLEGAESLNSSISDNVTSLVIYVLNNASLIKTETNRAFIDFSEFVDKMAFFKTMDNVNDFAGNPPSYHKDLNEQIIKEYGVESLEKFLNESGIDCKLTTYEGVNGSKIAQVSKTRNLDFFSVSSSGTMALAILFVWVQLIKKGEVSFAYIDEFDAFYHHKLAKSMAKHISHSSAQTVISTHNTSIMSNSILRPDCYFEIKNQKITPLYKLSDRELRKAHNLEKMYRSGAFDE